MGTENTDISIPTYKIYLKLYLNSGLDIRPICAILLSIVRTMEPKLKHKYIWITGIR